ncbi:MAG: hypothetical protein AB8I08_11270 [Sandaracinaceae bacterium]
MNAPAAPGKMCTWCHRPNDPRASHCWVCQSELPAEAAAPATEPAERSGTDGLLRAFGWLGLLFGLGFVSLLVGIELGSNWPGLLVPFALVMLVVFGGLGVTAYVHIRKSRAVEGERSAGETLFAGVALAVSLVFVLLALLFLLMIAAMVIFFLVCLAMIGGAGGFH